MHPCPRDGFLWVFLFTHQCSFLGDCRAARDSFQDSQQGADPFSALVVWKFQNKGSCSSFCFSIGSIGTFPKESGVKVEPVRPLLSEAGPALAGLRPLPPASFAATLSQFFVRLEEGTLSCAEAPSPGK